MRLIARAKDELATLVRAELENARREMTAKLKRLTVGVAALIGGLVFALFAVVALTVALIAALAIVVAPWLAAAIVTVAYVAIAAVLALVGRSLIAKALPPVPSSSLRHLKEDARWISHRISSKNA